MAKPVERYSWAKDARRVQLLGNGEWVRVFDHLSRGHQVPARPGVIAGVVQAVAQEDPECADRIIEELTAYGFEWAADLDCEPEE